MKCISSQPRPLGRHRPLRTVPRRAILLLALACAAGVPGTTLRAADVPPELVGRFTRGVQPLLLNKCAAGACHGGPKAHEPRLRRADVHGAIDRTSTLANLDTFLAMLGPNRDPQPLVELLAVQHPQTPASRWQTMKPLTSAERVTLESWIRALGDYQQASAAQAAAGQSDHYPVRQAGHEETVAPTPQSSKPNRFRTLLETGAPPPAPLNRQPTGRTEYGAILDNRKPAADAQARPEAVTPEDVRPESVPPARLPGTDDSPPARPGAPASPPPTSRGSR